MAMKFTLNLVPSLPNELVLTAEKPLSGVKFLEEASRCLRRSLDGSLRCRHQTMGNLATYAITVPQQIAIESGWFDDKNERYLQVEHAILNQYIFHAASYTNGCAQRSYYPYYQNEVVLTSYIDELAFIDVWRQRDYPEKMTINIDSGVNLPLVGDESEVEGPDVGDCILDDLMR